MRRALARKLGWSSTIRTVVAMAVILAHGRGRFHTVSRTPSVATRTLRGLTGLAGRTSSARGRLCRLGETYRRRRRVDGDFGADYAPARGRVPVDAGRDPQWRVGADVGACRQRHHAQRGHGRRANLAGLVAHGPGYHRRLARRRAPGAAPAPRRPGPVHR